MCWALKPLKVEMWGYSCRPSFWNAHPDAIFEMPGIPTITLQLVEGPPPLGAIPVRLAGNHRFRNDWRARRRLEDEVRAIERVVRRKSEFANCGVKI